MILEVLSIIILTVVIINSFRNRKKGIREQFTQIGKKVLWLSILFVLAYTIYKAITVENGASHFLAYFSYACKWVVVIWGSIYILNLFGVFKGVLTRQISS